jgi:hypothetical protein
VGGVGVLVLCLQAHTLAVGREISRRSRNEARARMKSSLAAAFTQESQVPDSPHSPPDTNVSPLLLKKKLRICALCAD